MKTYRVIVTSQAPFCDPVEWPYGPPQPSMFKALLSLGAALEAHDADDDRWTGLQAVRIDVVDVEVGTCDSHDGPHGFRNDPDPCIGWAGYV